MSNKFICLETDLARDLFHTPQLFQTLNTSSWIKNIWVTSQTPNIQLQLGRNIELPHFGDIKMMCLFVSHDFCSPSELGSFNCCQMYLCVFWVSAICTGTGNIINNQFWHKLQPRVSTGTWPQLEKPSGGDWWLWHKALTNALHFICNSRLASLLGPWLPSGAA